ncbi:MAG: hybrid sensor histidine kinase/response regulator, partial [Deltaproteobacteria bacterium]|nr:hybrid sensor histidine kinase/response regulator [Deltaproteobacteria bacterium]
MVPRSLRGKLVALVVAAVFPALVIIFYSGFERQNRELEQAKSRVLHIVHGLGAVQERLAASVEQLLIALAKTPMVRERDLQACTGLFRGLAEGNPFYHNVVLADSDGTMLAASLPFSGVSIADRSHFQEAGQNLRFTAGEYVEAKIDPRPIFVFTLPLVDEHGDFDGVLAAAMDLQGFEPLFSREHLPPGAFAGLVDRAGRRLFRIPADNPETFPLGVPIRGEVWDFVSGTTEEVAFIERISNEVTQILACHPLWLPGDERPYMYMVVGIPKAQVLAEGKALLVRDAGLLILAAFLALITAWVMGTRTVVGRFRRLEKTAEALSRGRLDAKTGLDYRDGELGRLAEAFDRMAEQLGENLAEERRIKKELMIERDRAEMANRSKSEFLANMSHEIRTPLNGIMGMMQLLQMSALDGQQKEFVGLAADSVQRLNRLLSDILDLSRVEAGKLDIHRAPFEIRTLEDSVLGLFTITAQDKGLELICVTDPTLPRRLVGDEARIRQVLFNLVGNALKFTDTGRISVEITALPERPSGEIRVLFSVSDTGMGIPEDKIRDIF